VNLRRGIKFAAIHLVISIPLIIWEIVPRWSAEKMHSLHSSPTLVLTGYQEEPPTVEFVPICEMWRSISWREKILSSAELPATVLSGWNSDCPKPWTVAGLIGIDIRDHSRAKEEASSFGFCGLIAIQWILLGSLPLIRPRRWWLEPGACNTLLTSIAVVPLVFGNCLELTHWPGSENAPVGIGLVVFPILLLVILTWPVCAVMLVSMPVYRGWHIFRGYRRSQQS
jgi:hypothetical protein